MKNSVVRGLIRLIDLRNTHVAFNGVLSVVDNADNELHMRWSDSGDFAELRLRLDQLGATITYSNSGQIETIDLADLVE